HCRLNNTSPSIRFLLHAYEQWRQQFPVEAMCRVPGVSRSGYYDRVQHAPSDRKQSDERLKLEIKVAHIRT
ncbi:IS3 family transposase, partial [Shigella boydii]